MAYGTNIMSNIPGIYVSVEARDMKLAESPFGRSCFVVILSDRGRHNQVVEVNNPNNFYREFGYPDLERYGYGHYLVDMALQYTNRVYVVRPALTDPEMMGDLTTEYDDCMALSHAYIYENDDIEPVSIIPETSMDSTSNIINLNDSTSLIADFEEGMWIFVDDFIQDARQVVEVDSDNYNVVLNQPYTGYIPIEPDGIHLSTVKRFQIRTANNLPGSSIETRLRSATDVDLLNPKIYYAFVGRGVGETYNKYLLKGYRNIKYEYMYTDSDGEPLYPYAFMDVGIYKYNEEDNSVVFVEGPWTVSLIPRTDSGTPIRDIFTGRDMFIETVINSNSDFVRCYAGKGVNKLSSFNNSMITKNDAANRRLYILSLFSYQTVHGTNVIATNNDNRINGGFFLQKGENGLLFNEDGTLNYNDTYHALVTQAYMGKLTSIDGSIELLQQILYPRYMLDYVFCGGYGISEIDGARTLVDIRGDTMLLSDLGYNFNKTSDEKEQRHLSGWNTWNMMIYSQWRQMFDEHTGKDIWMTPIYDEIEHHLSVDNNYGISEPVAGIEKGALQRTVELAYKPTLEEISDLIDAQINPTIDEPDGRYTLTQLTTFKRLSSMGRGNWVKFVHYIQKEIPRQCKDILQTKATSNVYKSGLTRKRINAILNPYVDTGENNLKATLSSFNLEIAFDELRNELKVVIVFDFLGIVEKIAANIIVV